MRHVLEVQLIATSQEVGAYGAVAEHQEANVRLGPQPIRGSKQQVQVLLTPHVAGVHDRESPGGYELPSKLVLLQRNRCQLPAVDRIRDNAHLCPRARRHRSCPALPASCSGASSVTSSLYASSAHAGQPLLRR